MNCYIWCMFLVVFLLSVYNVMFVQASTEHNTHCMTLYKPREPQSETAPARTPHYIANGELLKNYLFDLSSRYCNKVALLWSQNLLP